MSVACACDDHADVQVDRTCVFLKRRLLSEEEISEAFAREQTEANMGS